jgi:hypothetical protein
MADLIQVQNDMTSPRYRTSRQGGQRSAWRRSAVVAVLWVGAVLGGLAAMARYEFTSGGDSAAPGHWPAQSGLARTTGQETLLVFAHPKCPCTVATFDELSKVMSKAGQSTNVQVVFFKPTGADPEWIDTPSMHQAAAIPGVTVVVDEGGKEAELFHALTSGRTLLYRAGGELVFDGGITAARGHAGDNAGATALAALLAAPSSVPTGAPVFGCSLRHCSTPRNSTPCPR